jgi:hypothetical protein
MMSNSDRGGFIFPKTAHIPVALEYFNQVLTVGGERTWWQAIV